VGKTTTGGTVNTTANDLTNMLLAEVPKRYKGARMWRRNVGTGIPPANVKAAMGMLLRGDMQGALDMLKRARPVSFGLAGEPDIDGFIVIEGIAIRAGIEVKIDDKQSEAQKLFELMIRKSGGIYVLAYTFDEGMAELGRQVEAIRGKIRH